MTAKFVLKDGLPALPADVAAVIPLINGLVGHIDIVRAQIMEYATARGIERCFITHASAESLKKTAGSHGSCHWTVTR